MLSVSSAISRPSVSALSKPLFVTYPSGSKRRTQSVQVLVLAAVGDDRVAAPPTRRLVTVTIKKNEQHPDLSDSNKSGKRFVHLDVGNDQRTIREILFPNQFYMADGNVFKQQAVVIDEGHLHSALSSWNKKTDVEKALILGSYMTTTPAMTFTLRFSQDRQDSIKRNPGAMFRSMRNHFAEVKRLGPTVMTLEMDKQGRPHIHGVVATAQSERTVRDALWPAGGRSGNPGFNYHQLKVKPTDNALGWLCYMTKDLLKLPEEESAQLIDISQSAKQVGESHFMKLRELSRSKLGITPDMRGRAAFYHQKALAAVNVMSASTSGITRH